MKSTVCRIANQLTKEGYTRSDAFKMAWAEVKANATVEPVNAPVEMKEADNTADTIIAAKARQFKEIQRMIEELEKQAAAVKEDIIAEMGEAEEISADIFKIKYITVISNRLDTSKFKKEQTEIYNAYLKQSASKRFTVTA